MASSTLKNEGMDVVWENPSPYADFGAQTISVDLSDYKAVLIMCYEYPQDANRRIINSEVCKKNDTTRINCGYFPPNGGQAASFASRPVFPTDTSLIFSQAVNSGGVNNGQCVPIIAYGIK